MWLTLCRVRRRAGAEGIGERRERRNTRHTTSPSTRALTSSQTSAAIPSPGAVAHRVVFHVAEQRDRSSGHASAGTRLRRAAAARVGLEAPHDDAAEAGVEHLATAARRGRPPSRAASRSLAAAAARAREPQRDCSHDASRCRNETSLSSPPPHSPGPSLSRLRASMWSAAARPRAGADAPRTLRRRRRRGQIRPLRQRDRAHRRCRRRCHHRPRAEQSPPPARGSKISGGEHARHGRSRPAARPAAPPSASSDEPKPPPPARCCSRIVSAPACATASRFDFSASFGAAQRLFLLVEAPLVAFLQRGLARATLSSTEGGAAAAAAGHGRGLWRGLGAGALWRGLEVFDLAARLSLAVAARDKLVRREGVVAAAVASGRRREVDNIGHPRR